MTDCPNGDVRDLLPDYLHDRLASSVRASVEHHLVGCATCRDELALLRDLRGTLQHAPRIDVAAIAAAIPPYRAPARKRWASDWRAAAAIAAIAVGGTSIALLSRTHEPTQVAQLPVASSTAAAPVIAHPAPAPDPQPAVPHAPPAPPAARPAPSVTPAPAPRGEELAMAGGAIADLSDGELSALLGDLESLDAVPSTEVESAVSPLSAGRRGRHD